MSISNPRLKNPANKFIEFKGDKGLFRYYDKEAEKNVEIDLPARFIVLDQLNTIVGYNEPEGSGIYSNEVHSLTEEVLFVRYFKKGTLAKGTYDNIRDKVIANGGKFCKVIYAALKTGNELELVSFKFSGAAFGAWLEFAKKVDLSAKGVEITGEFEEGKKGSIKYKVPIFKPLSLPDEYIQKAIEIDKGLQEYFKAYKTQQREVINSETTESSFSSSEYEQASRGGDEGFVPVEKSDPADKVKETDEGFRKEGDDLPF